MEVGLPSLLRSTNRFKMGSWVRNPERKGGGSLQRLFLASFCHKMGGGTLRSEGYLAEASQIVAQEVHDHQILCPCLCRGQQGVLGLLVQLGADVPPGGALDGARLHRAVPGALEESLGGGTADLQRHTVCIRGLTTN